MVQRQRLPQQRHLILAIILAKALIQVEQQLLHLTQQQHLILSLQHQRPQPQAYPQLLLTTLAMTQASQQQQHSILQQYLIPQQHLTQPTAQQPRLILPTLQQELLIHLEPLIHLSQPLPHLIQHRCLIQQPLT